MKVCLVAVQRKPAFIPLAALYLKASLVERAGLACDDVEIIEYPYTATPAEIAAGILAVAPDVVGLSCYVWNIVTFRAVVDLVRTARPAVTIVMGGPEVGPLAAETLRVTPAVDAVVKAEGEVPLTEIIGCLRAGRSLASVAGIAWLNGTTIVDNGDALIIQDVNVLPSPHQDRYVSGDDRIACIETQRGCVFRCSFCFYNKDLSIRNRRFNLDRVKREIDFWLERGATELFLMDPVFNLYADRAKEICAYIAARNHKRVPIHAEVWAEFIDDELARLMRDANVNFLEVGLQTTDESVLMTVERRLKVQKFLDGVGYLRKYGLDYEVQLIFGLPGETMASFMRSLSFAVTLAPPDLAVFMLMVLPGTELWRQAGTQGLAFDAEPPYYVRHHASMTPDDIAAGWQIIDATRFLWPTTTFRLFARDSPKAFVALLESWRRLAEAHKPSERPDLLMAALVDACGQHGLPAAFYEACWLRESSTALEASGAPGASRYTA